MNGYKHQGSRPDWKPDRSSFKARGIDDDIDSAVHGRDRYHHDMNDNSFKNVMRDYVNTRNDQE